MTTNSRIVTSLDNLYDSVGDSISKDDITIVIPTLNEEDAICLVIEELLLEGYNDILLVDGYSSDDTVKVARRYDVRILNQHGIGKTGAISTAIEFIKKPYLVIIDGDCTYSPKDISKFLPHLANFNEIIGARTYGRENISWLNRMGNDLINRLFNLFFSTTLTDVCSGLYALKTDFAKELVFMTNGFDVEVEIAAQATHKGSITQVPIDYRERIGTRKLNPLRDGFKIIMTIMKWARIINSVVFYSFLVGLSVIPSMIVLLWAAIEYLSGTWHSGVTLIAVMLTLIANQAITFSFLASQHRRLENKLNLKNSDS